MCQNIKSRRLCVELQFVCSSSRRIKMPVVRHDLTKLAYAPWHFDTTTWKSRLLFYYWFENNVIYYKILLVKYKRRGLQYDVSYFDTTTWITTMSGCTIPWRHFMTRRRVFFFDDTTCWLDETRRHHYMLTSLAVDTTWLDVIGWRYHCFWIRL